MTPQEKNIPYGYCHCGCGNLTRVSEKTQRRFGFIKGVPRKYCWGHHRKGYRKVVAPIAELVGLYESGLTSRQIAAKFSVDHSTILERLKEVHVERRNSWGAAKIGEEHPLWKGDNAGYFAFHARLPVRRGKPSKCEVCGTTDPQKHYDWANLTGRYEDMEDYKRMCRKCHRQYDKQRRDHD